MRISDSRCKKLTPLTRRRPNFRTCTKKCMFIFTWLCTKAEVMRLLKKWRLSYRDYFYCISKAQCRHSHRLWCVRHTEREDLTFLDSVLFFKWALWSWSIAFCSTWNGGRSTLGISFLAGRPIGCLERWNCFLFGGILQHLSLYISLWWPHSCLVISTPFRSR